MTTEVLNVQADANFSFFLTRNMYAGDFLKIWAREVVQNAVDAKTKNIQIFNERNQNNDVSILTVIDNGTGMTQDIVKNNFLVLGGSYKDEIQCGGIRQVTGGLGIAKSICTGGDVKYPGPFGNNVFWYVETTAYENGKLVSYYLDSEMLGKEPIREIETKPHTGTKIVIHRKGCMYDYLIKDIIHNSNVVPIFFEGDQLYQLRRARKQEISHLFSDDVDTSWLDVYHKKTVLRNQENKIIYRINGIVQFTERDNHIPGALIFEIKTNKKPWDEEYPLTPTREQIKDGYGYREVIDKIIDEFKVRKSDEDEESFVFETFENDAYNDSSYEKCYEKNIEHSGLHKTREDSLVNNTKNSIAFEPSSKEIEYEEEYERVVEMEKELEEKLETEEREQLRKYEQMEKEKEIKRLKTEKVQHVFNKAFNVIKSNNDEYISKFNTVFSSQLPSITIKREKSVKTAIDLYNAKNAKTLLVFKLFIDMVFEITNKHIHTFDYEIGWSLNETQQVEFIKRDGRKFLLLNPLNLNISDVRLFTNKVLNKLVFEMLKESYYYTSDHMCDNYFNIMEECIYPNQRSFEKTAKKVLRTNV